MLQRFNKGRRYRVGLLLALTYLLCVLGPGLAYAVGGNDVAAPCFEDGLAISVVHHHDEGGHSHHHASAAGAEKGLAGHTSHQHGKAEGPCCAMLCVSGLAAHAAPDFAPLRVASICKPESFRAVVGQDPARLYRPPIA